MRLLGIREKSSQTRQLADLRDNRAFSEIICQTQEDNSPRQRNLLGVKLYEKNVVCLMQCKGEVA